ncbi:MAG: 2-C-methyl-D-erythritol 4-phosphate cytidylyltransferase [Sphingobacteriales bacterium]|nr:MAG: 2-C-methyl-D-erythritol 4-phosphate cytidylyltransferase [Sphingobacteriales bacterium]
MNASLPVYAVIVAGGSGSRMGTALPKQFLDLAGKPVLAHTLAAFLAARPDMQLVLVLPAADLSKAQMVLQAFPERLDIELVVGGSTRFESVKNGLAVVPEQAVVLVHDGVRCLVSPGLIQHCIEEALQNENAIPVIPVTDSIRQVSETTSEPVDRITLRSVQTPQAFHAGKLKAAFWQPFQDAFTDEATVWEHAGHPVHLIPGEKTNLKITTPEDLEWAAFLLGRAAAPR